METYQLPTNGQLTSWVESLQKLSDLGKLFLSMNELDEGQWCSKLGTVRVTLIQRLACNEKLRIVIEGFLGHPFIIRVSDLSLETFVDGDNCFINFAPCWLLPIDNAYNAIGMAAGADGPPLPAKEKP